MSDWYAILIFEVPARSGPPMEVYRLVYFGERDKAAREAFASLMHCKESALAMTCWLPPESTLIQVEFHSTVLDAVDVIDSIIAIEESEADHE